MARFKPVQKGLLLLPVDLSQRIVPGRFAQALCYLVDREPDRYVSVDVVQQHIPCFNRRSRRA